MLEHRTILASAMRPEEVLPKTKLKQSNGLKGLPTKITNHLKPLSCSFMQTGLAPYKTLERLELAVKSGTWYNGDLFRNSLMARLPFYDRIIFD